MKQTFFSSAGRNIRLCEADASNAPLVVLHSFGEEAKEVLAAVGEAPFHLLFVDVPDWERDLTPWACPPLRRGGAPCSGKADAYLPLLTGVILPDALARLAAAPRCLAIAGYSLAGLFALYALYRTDVFSRAASVSGSLWYPEFLDFCRANTPRKTPDRLYLSLGDREPNTRHPLMRTVGERTEALAAFYAAAGIPTAFEWNPGGHFTDPGSRTARALFALLT